MEDKRYLSVNIFVEKKDSPEQELVDRWASEWDASILLCEKKPFLGKSSVYEVVAAPEALAQLPESLELLGTVSATVSGEVNP